jgi:hypothetical protein
MAQVIEQFSSNPEALSSIPSTGKKKEKKRRRKKFPVYLGKYQGARLLGYRVRFLFNS